MLIKPITTSPKCSLSTDGCCRKRHVKSEFKQNGPYLRASIDSPGSRDVRWRVKFEPARF